MTIFAPRIEGRPGPKYMAIAQAIADDIATGALSPGARMPPHRDLAWRLGVTVGTVSRAYAQAQRRGLVHGEVGRGTYVLDPLSTGATSFEQGALAPLGDNAPIEMTRNAPPQGPHADALAASLGALATAEPAALYPLLAYHEAAGPPSHREAGCAWLARVGLETAADALIMTTPPQQAKHLLQDCDVDDQLAGIEMTPCWAIMAVLDRPLLRNWDASFVNSGPLSWISNQSSRPQRPQDHAYTESLVRSAKRFGGRIVGDSAGGRGHLHLAGCDQARQCDVVSRVSVDRAAGGVDTRTVRHGDPAAAGRVVIG